MRIGFLCLARDAGGAIRDLLADIARAAQPGDRVVILTDDGGAGTAAQAARFAAMEGFPPGTETIRILTGARGAGDAGIAANLALEQAAGLDRVLVLPGRARLDPAGTEAARALARAGADLVIAAAGLAGPAGTEPRALPGLASGCPAATAAPVLGRTLFDPRLIPPGLAPCLEGGAGHGDLPLLFALVARSAAPAGSGTPLVDLPWSAAPGRGLAAAARETIRRDPRAAEWIARHLGALLDGIGPGEAHARQEELSALAHDLGQAAPLAVALAAGGARARAALRAQAGSPAAPALSGRAPVRIACEGPHARRMPFAYPVLAAEWEGRIERVEAPENADLILWAHPRDLIDLPPATAQAAQRRPAALFSEEPFWDTLFSPDPLAPAVVLRAGGGIGGLRLHQVNHHRSAIFDFDRIPYFCLTDPAYARRYAAHFVRNAAKRPADWLAAWAACPVRTAFMAERRPEPFHDLALPEGGILGLCAWRTRLAETCRAGRVERLGTSWQGGPTRFELTDWHEDKLDRLDGRAMFLSAVENTHQPAYVSEKPFDAFACGALPLYVAEPGHRMHDLGLPEEAWLNLRGLGPEEAARRVDTARPDTVTAAAYAAAQARLAALWTDGEAIAAERRRIGRAVLAEVLRLVAAGPA